MSTVTNRVKSAAYRLPERYAAGEMTLPLFTTDDPTLFESEARARGYRLNLVDAIGKRHSIPQPLAKQIAPRKTPRTTTLYAPQLGQVGSWVTFKRDGIMYTGQVWAQHTREDVWVVTDDGQAHSVWTNVLTPAMHTSHMQDALA